MSTFFIPSINMIGKDCLFDAVDSIKSHGFKKTLVVTDKVLVDIGLVGKVTTLLNENDIETIVFDGTQPNPTTANVEAGLKLLQENHCDSVITLGGGSPHDCGKGIALVATNGGVINDYEGVDQSAKPQHCP